MPKIIDHQQYREELLLRSFPLFAEHGYAGTTTRQLAKGLEVSTGTLYHYFPSKEVLFEQMIEHLMKQEMKERVKSNKATRSLSERMAGMAWFFEKNKEQLTVQARLCFDYCRHLQQEGRDPKEFWARVKPRYQELSDTMFGNDDGALHEFMGTLIQGILLRFAWEDPSPPQLDLIFSTLALFVSKAFPDGGPSES